MSSPASANSDSSAFGGVSQRGADAGGRASCQRMAEPVPGAADTAGAGRPDFPASVQAALGGRPGGDDLAAGCLSVAGGVTGLAGCAEPASGGARRP